VSFEAAARGLRSTYSRARAEMAAAYRRPSAERFHDWRRHVRYHALHASLLRDVCGRVAASRARRAGDLAETLGVEHDLAVLGSLLMDRPAPFGGTRSVAPLLDLIERRRTELRTAARPAGKRLFAARPAEVTNRFTRRWEHHLRRETAVPAGLARSVAA
jgi:hypothetical protein